MSTARAYQHLFPALTNQPTKEEKVIVGGVPVTQAYADQIGADGYGTDAVAAVEKARALISTQSH